jgi:hypothetical protein
MLRDLLGQPAMRVMTQAVMAGALCPHALVSTGSSSSCSLVALSGTLLSQTDIAVAAAAAARQLLATAGSVHETLALTLAVQRLFNH